jgi:hypothetical protein
MRRYNVENGLMSKSKEIYLKLSFFVRVHGHGQGHMDMDIFCPLLLVENFTT